MRELGRIGWKAVRCWGKTAPKSTPIRHGKGRLSGENADPAITAPIAEQCKLNSVPCAWVRTMQELGRACGIEVGAAAAAAVD